MLYFIHIPRTGGNSVIGAISDTKIQIIRHDLRNPNYRFYKDIAQENDRAICFVRHPLSRVYSAYNFLKNGGLHQPDANDAYLLGINNLTFDEFVKYKLEDALKWQIHFIPQYRWIFGVKDISIYKFEYFDEEFMRMLSDHQLEGIDYPIKSNPSFDYNELKSTVSTKIQKIIRKLYKEDLKMFKYNNIN